MDGDSRILATERFRRDAEEIVAWYPAETEDPGLPDRFVDALQLTVKRIAGHPDAGSRRFADAVRMPGVRASPVTGFPYLVFSVGVDETVRLLRILHVRRDIPSALHGEPPSRD